MRQFLTQAQRDAADDAAFRQAILIAMMRTGRTRSEVASALGMTRGTFRTRMDDPARFTRGECRTLERFLRMEESI